ncbi:MAG: tetratricopeptide repeat protein [Phycisphaerae bacterium]|jgi:tetratricopeptide (TPR) repeat protein
MSRLEQLRKLLEAAPDDPLAHYVLGLEHANLAQYDEAIAAFAGALAVDARYSAAYYHKAKAEIKAGRRDDARQTLTAGLEVARSAGDMKTAREMQDLLDTIA